VHGNAEHHPSTGREPDPPAGPARRKRRERTSEARPPVSGNHQREALRRPEKLQADLIERLEAEWPALAAGALAARLPSWAAEEPALAGFATPQQLLRHIRASRGNTRAEDAVMTALVRQAGSDPVAARMVLHALLPGLKTLARRILLDADQRDELWSSLLAHCWERIRCYPLERRPRRIAANILFEALKKTTREFRRELRDRDRFGLGNELPSEQEAPTPVDRDVEQLIGRAVAAAAISEEEAQLILRSRIDRADLRQLAANDGVAYNTLVVRRLRAERRLLLFIGKPAVTSAGSKGLLSSARVIGAGLTGSAGRGAATHEPRRR
jgi:hypothetical protein